MVDPTPPTPDPEPEPEPPAPVPTNDNVSATFNATSYNLTTANVALKATIAKEDASAIAAEDKTGWSVVDDSGSIIQTGNTSVTAKGVITINVKRAKPEEIKDGSATVKLVKDNKTYATTTVNYKSYAVITTNSTTKLTTDGPEEVTALRLNGAEVNVADFTITSKTPDVATVTIQEGKTIITPSTAGVGTFAIAKTSDPSKEVTVSITFFKPAAKVGDKYVKTLTEAFKNVASGETITLQEDITESVSFTGQTPRVQDFEVTLDLNGHTITAPSNKDWALRVDYGTVTLKDSIGTGGITYGKNYAIMVSHLAGDYPSKLIIESGNYTGQTSVAQVGYPGGSGTNYKYYGGDLVINGGKFTAVPDSDETYDADGNFKYLLNMLDMVESKYAGGIYSPSTIEVKGGEFYKFNPADNAAEGANTNFVAEGYQSTKDGDWYKVSAA